MRDRRKRSAAVSWSSFFWFTILIVVSSALFTTFSFSTLRRYYFGESFHPSVVLPWRTPEMAAKSGDSPTTPAITVRETVELPDQILLFLNYPPSSRFYTKDDVRCVYFSAKGNSSEPQLTLPPIKIDQMRPNQQIIRCPLQPGGFTLSVAVKPNVRIETGSTSNYMWNPLAYDALIDRDNTTILFVKGLNLRPERLAIPSRFECVYGWDFKRPKLMLKADVVSVAQEIVRCRTPVSILSGQQRGLDSVKVSVRVEGRGIFPSIARPGQSPQLDPPTRKAHELCVCTMLRNQARFMKEWVMYHTRIGVQRWFIYDNNSDDDINIVIHSLQSANYNITRHVWPWIKTQEAGFAHCALRARDECKWVGFIDVDEFFNLKSGKDLHEVIQRHSGAGNVAELRTSCYSFGPSGLKERPREGVMVGYTCRLVARERHKSIVRPEALNYTLINVVHHFHLKGGYTAVDVEHGMMVINHYKYQVWEVFKDKFYRRVATFVADWQEDQNVGSKDRAPGLGTKAVEPADWSDRFCEVRDMQLRDWVLRTFADRRTHLLPWQPEYEHRVKRRRRRRKQKGFFMSSTKSKKPVAIA